MFLKIDINSDPFLNLGKGMTEVTGSKAGKGFLQICNDYFMLISVSSIVACFLTLVGALVVFMLKKKPNKKAELQDIFTTKLIVLVVFELIPLILEIVVQLAQAF